MARIVVHTMKRPLVHRTKSGDAVAICMCGMSRKYPFCDGSHRKLPEEDEDSVYVYSEDLQLLGRVEKLVVDGQEVSPGELGVKRV